MTVTIGRRVLLAAFGGAGACHRHAGQPNQRTDQSEVRDAQAAAERLGQLLRIFNVGSDREIDTAFATIVDQRIGGPLVQPDPLFTGRRVSLCC
jgi:hypothetical protein